MKKLFSFLKSGNIEDKIGEVGVYVYALSIMVSKGKINFGLGLMFLGFLIRMYKKRKTKLLAEEKFFLVVLILTPIFSLLSPGGFDSFETSFHKSYRYFGIFLIPMFLTNSIILKRTIALIFTSFGINFFKAILIFKTNGFNPPYTRYVSFGGNTLNESHMNAMLLLLSFSVCIYFVKNKPVIYKILSVLLFGMISWALVLGQGRGAWLGAILALLLVAFLLIEKKKNYFIGVLIALALGVGSLKVPVVKNSPFAKRLMSIKETKSDASNGIRLRMWEGSIDMFKKHPIFGVGRDNSPEYFLDYFESNHRYDDISYGDSLKSIGESGNAHNMYFTSLGEEGLLVFGFVGMFAYLFYQEIIFLFKRKKYALVYCVTLGMIGMLVAFCIGGLTENNWQEFWKSSMVCASIGIYLAMKKNAIGD